MKISPAVRFVLLFVVLLAVLGGAYAWLTARYATGLDWLMEGTAGISSGALDVLADDVRHSGKNIAYRGFGVEIIDECTGLLEMVIFLAAVLAFPTTWKKKLIGIALGIPAIWLFNIIRILFLLIAGDISRGLFDFMHLYFWQATLIIMIGTVWVGWLYLVVFREAKRPVAVSG